MYVPGHAHVIQSDCHTTVRIAIALYYVRETYVEVAAQGHIHKVVWMLFFVCSVQTNIEPGIVVITCLQILKVNAVASVNLQSLKTDVIH